jgi:hypothetical protein
VASKLKIKIGQIEIDCEASEEFLKAEIPVLLKAAMEMAEASSEDAGSAAGKGDGAAPKQKVGGLSLTTASIAAKLDVKSGPDLLKAAAAQLTLYGNKETFTRAELHDAMKSASGYYNKNYFSNLTKILASLVGDQTLVEVAKDTYALSAGTKTSLGAVLANS